MDLNLSDEVANHVLALASKDPELARSFALAFLDAVDKIAMAHYLLADGVALNLLTERLQAQPARALRVLEGLAARAVAPGRRRGPVAGRAGRKPAARKQAVPASKKGRRKRQRLTDEQAQQLKSQVRAFLGKHGGSTRKAITSAVRFTTAFHYDRIMGELKAAKAVVQRGEKSKTVYALGSSKKTRKMRKTT
jgi:hypothetical protein